ncbi:hypothetical protein [Clostridium minihomine]|uniref:hypothetical protein n=1 Tax=Clostridium minihomine TaxID=2045012 RepID=UPI000C76565A|nr:hypothetical protein [Clostridium minihomine]
MLLLILLAFCFAVLLSPVFRCAVLHPVKAISYGFKDSVAWYQEKRYNLCRTGELLAYVGLFGKGKTLSVVHRAVSDYKRYNDKKVWCSRRKKWVTQKVRVLSNVSLSIPYEQFVSLSQIIYHAEHSAVQDDLNDTLTVTLVLGDEFSVQMNSRNFKTNIDPLFLNTLLTCRHYHISLFYTAQRFSHVDALLRQVTSAVIDCDKLWRFQRQNVYDAWEMENAANVQLIRPLIRRAWFVTDADYNAYDTLACVGNLQKSVKDGDMLSSAEILALQCNQSANVEAVTQPSRKLVRMRKGK